MSPSQIFSLMNLIALVMWLLILFLPKWKITKLLITYKLVPLALAVFYTIYIIAALITDGMMDFGSLENVMALFTTENGVLVGWVHYLAFDLLVGMWLLEQNQSLKFPHLVMVPCLLATFMFGPLGFLMFMMIKFIKTKTA